MLEKVWVLLFALCMCVVGLGACSILRILTRDGNIHNKNINIKDIRRIFPQLFRKMWNSKENACYRAVFIAAMFFLGVKLSRHRMDIEAYALSFCVIVIITLLSYDARLIFIYGLISSILALFFFAGFFDLNTFSQGVVEQFLLPVDQALTVYMGCSIVCAVVFSFSIIFAIFHKGNLRHSEEHQAVAARGGNVLENFWGMFCPLITLVSIPISCILSAAFVFTLWASYA